MERKSLNWTKAGLLFCFLHLKVRGIDLLPDFVGILMFLMAVRCHSRRTETERRMEPFLFVLAADGLMRWIASLGRSGVLPESGMYIWIRNIFENGVESLLVTVISMYAFYVLMGEVMNRIGTDQSWTAEKLGWMRIGAVVLLSANYLTEPYKVIWISSLLSMVTFVLLVAMLVVLWQIEPLQEQI